MATGDVKGTEHWGLNDDGFYAPTFEEIRDQMKARYQVLLGKEVEYTGTDPISIMINVSAWGFAQIWGVAARFWHSWHPENATGIMLDNLCGVVGVKREPATYGRIRLILLGDEGTPLPAGRLVRHEPSGKFLVLQTDLVLELPPGTPEGNPEGVQARAEGLFKAEEIGELIMAPGDLFTRHSIVAGWYGLEVSGEGDIINGRDAETDDALRARRQDSLRVLGASCPAGIENRVLLLPFVTAARCINNPEHSTDPETGLPPHSWMVVVWPSELTAQEESLVARAIAAVMPTGTKSMGDKAFLVTSSTGGVKETVRFSYAESLDVYVSVSYTPGLDAPEDIEELIDKGVRTYFASLMPGDVVKYSALLCDLLEVEGVVDVAVQLGTSYPALGTANIEPGHGVIAVVAKDVTIGEDIIRGITIALS